MAVDAAQIAAAIEAEMATHPSGIISVTIDGVATTYSWDQAVKALEFWEERAARAANKRRIFNYIDLRGA